MVMASKARTGNRTMKSEGSYKGGRHARRGWGKPAEKGQPLGGRKIRTGSPGSHADTFRK